MKELDIKGYKVLLDDEDYDRVAALKWYVDKSTIKKRGKVYFYHGFYYDKKKKYSMSLQRFLLNLPRGDSLLGDHINGDTLDNRRCNLRACTVAENTQNMKMPRTNTIGLKGVSFFKPNGKYRARICVDNKQRLLGYFSTPEEAHEAYCKASKELHGEFGRTE